MVSTQQTYRPDIDGLRAVSIIFALIYHGFPQAFTGGFIGADVFFVISGYLITRQIYDQTRTRSFSFLNFYARRIRRIFPPLILILIFVGIYGYFFLNLGDFTSLFKHIAAGSVFLSNFVLWQEINYFEQLSALKPLLHLWSLAIEEQFYIVWPLLIVALTAVSRRYRGALIWILLFICVASFVGRIYVAAGDSIAAFYSPLSRFWELGLGGLLAVLQLDQVKVFTFNWSQSTRNIAAATGSICLLACALLLSGQDHFQSPLATLPALSALAIIAAGPSAAINRRLLSCKPMVQLGLISYALYLWHWPLLAFMRIEEKHNSTITIWLILASSFILAALTRTLVEQPIRRSQVHTAPILLLLALAGTGIAGIVGYKTEFLWTQRMHAQAQIQEQVRTAWRTFNAAGIPNQNCAELVAADTPAFRNCRIWGAPDARHTIAVWGDSMSIFWISPFLAASQEHGWRVIQFSHTGCPAIIGVHRSDRTDLACRTSELSEQIMAAMHRVKPDVVFLIGRWNLFYYGHIKNDVLVESTFITDGADKATAESAKKSFTRYMPETIKQLSEFSRVVVFKDTPVLKVPVDIGVTTRPDNFEPTADETKYFEKEINRVIDTAVMQTPNAIAFDPTTRLCNATKCPAYIDGLPAYFDEVHLTAHAAMQFLPDIEMLGGPQ